MLILIFLLKIFGCKGTNINWNTQKKKKKNVFNLHTLHICVHKIGLNFVFVNTW